MSDNTNDFIGALLESNIWGKAGLTVKATEKKPIVESKEEVVTEEDTAETHMCPLCESQLEAPLDEENVSLFVEALLFDDEDLISEDTEDETEDTDSEDE